MPDWKAKPYTNIDKRITITGPGDLTMFVDNDDVNNANVRHMVTRMLECLNRHFVADYGPVTFEPNTGRIRFMRDVIREFVRQCHAVKPPTLKEHRGRTPEVYEIDCVNEILQYPDDVRAIEIIMLKLDTKELPGKVNAWRKVLAGTD